MNRLLYIIIGVVLMAACKPGVPSGVIPPDDMEDILVDYHLAKAMAMQGEGSHEERDYLQLLYIDAALRKHGVSKADFDSSLVYYYSRTDHLVEMYRRIGDRLDKQALALGASESEIAKYSAVATGGDTASIWVERRSALLSAFPPRNRFEFEIPVDTTYRRGDVFMLQFVSDFVCQMGVRDGMVVMSVNCEGDTVITRSLHFSSSGINQLRLECPSDKMPSRLRGFFYLGGANEQTTVMRLLFLNSMQLIRFHTQKEKDDDKQTIQPLQKDSIKFVDNGNGQTADTASHRDTVGQGGQHVSAGKGTAVHRVDRRLREAEN